MLTAGMTSCLNEKPDGADGLSLASNAMMVETDGFGTENSTTSAPMMMALLVGSLKFIVVPLRVSGMVENEGVVGLRLGSLGLPRPQYTEGSYDASADG